ncbi:PAS domain-containing sensor histidine kinase [Winogradskyella bathintestinalis]|uniref:histidine kinase n=1 Tax=Winogradskyella bathintestinalis TaxID=3035208 RepID=A0ABT7ZVA0_9FLAO|nr:PAS domain S-box protein [Winogradskyella bathintestinalis]MDN3492930.1 PAS domain S-box protein [Winogradskyella bathintestinalis]
MNTTEAKLPISKELSLLNFIQKHAAIGTWEYYPVLEVGYWSDQTKKIYEVPLDYEPTLESGLSFYKGDNFKMITKVFTDCIEKHQDYDIEIQIVTATGKTKWVRAIGKPIIKEEKCVKIEGLFQDIDEKTKISKALAFKREQLSRTFETALIGMAIVDLEGHWIDVNKSLCKTFGYTKDEIKELTFMDVTHPDDLNKGYKAMMSMLSGKLDFYETEKRYISKSGETIWAQLSTSVVRDDRGQPQHFVAQINDLTRIKKSSIKISQLLTTTEDQNKRLLNFAHIVSHNLRSHYGNLDMLLDIVKMDLPETTENDIFPLIEQAVGQLGETVENLNQVAAINIQNDITTEPLNLLDNLNKALSNISAIIIESKSTVSVDINPDIMVQGIPAYLDSILLNFLTNAIKYKKPNEAAKIELHASIKNDFVVLEIKDYGQGIDLKKHGEKLFGMYKTFHTHEDSRGLGLFITKNQIEAIGGKVEVASKVNEGTTFFIHLKLHE